jgi:hypothetical protein
MNIEAQVQHRSSSRVIRLMEKPVYQADGTELRSMLYSKDI